MREEKFYRITIWAIFLSLVLFLIIMHYEFRSRYKDSVASGFNASKKLIVFSIDNIIVFWDVIISTLEQCPDDQINEILDRCQTRTNVWKIIKNNFMHLEYISLNNFAELQVSWIEDVNEEISFLQEMFCEIDAINCDLNSTKFAKQILDLKTYQIDGNLQLYLAIDIQNKSKTTIPNTGVIGDADRVLRFNGGSYGYAIQYVIFQKFPAQVLSEQISYSLNKEGWDLINTEPLDREKQKYYKKGGFYSYGNKRLWNKTWENKNCDKMDVYIVYHDYQRALAEVTIFFLPPKNKS